MRDSARVISQAEAAFHDLVYYQGARAVITSASLVSNALYVPTALENVPQAIIARAAFERRSNQGVTIIFTIG